MKKPGSREPPARKSQQQHKNRKKQPKRVPLPDAGHADARRHATLLVGHDGPGSSSDVDSLDEEDMEMLDDLGSDGLQFLSR